MNLSGLAGRAPQVLSLLRIVAGLMFMQHGAQKIFGFPEAARGPFELMSQMGIGGVLELVGGALIVLGLFTRPVAFLLSGMMAVAYFQSTRVNWLRCTAGSSCTCSSPARAPGAWTR